MYNGLLNQTCLNSKSNHLCTPSAPHLSFFHLSLLSRDRHMLLRMERLGVCVMVNRPGRYGSLP